MVRWQARATAAAAQQLVRVCWYGVHFVQRFSTKSNRSLPLWLGGRSSDGSDELGCGSGSGSRYGGDNRYGSGSSNYGASMWSRGRSLTRATLQTETAPALPGSRRRRRVMKKKGSTAADMCMRRPLFGLRPVLTFLGYCRYRYFVGQAVSQALLRQHRWVRVLLSIGCTGGLQHQLPVQRRLRLGLRQQRELLPVRLGVAANVFEQLCVHKIGNRLRLQFGVRRRLGLRLWYAKSAPTRRFLLFCECISAGRNARILRRWAKRRKAPQHTINGACECSKPVVRLVAVRRRVVIGPLCYVPA